MLPATRNNMAFNGVPPRLTFSKSLVESTLSREMVDFILGELNLTKAIDQIENGRYGIDEILFSTLNSHDAINAPGGFTQKCSKRGTDVYHVTR